MTIYITHHPTLVQFIICALSIIVMDLALYKYPFIIIIICNVLKPQKHRIFSMGKPEAQGMTRTLDLQEMKHDYGRLKIKHGIHQPDQGNHPNTLEQL